MNWPASEIGQSWSCGPVGPIIVFWYIKYQYSVPCIVVSYPVFLWFFVWHLPHGYGPLPIALRLIDTHATSNKSTTLVKYVSSMRVKRPVPRLSGMPIPGGKPGPMNMLVMHLGGGTIPLGFTFREQSSSLEMFTTTHGVIVALRWFFHTLSWIINTYWAGLTCCWRVVSPISNATSKYFHTHVWLPDPCKSHQLLSSVVIQDCVRIRW